MTFDDLTPEQQLEELTAAIERQIAAENSHLEALYMEWLLEVGAEDPVILNPNYM